VHSQFSTSLSYSLDDLLHHFCVPGNKTVHEVWSYQGNRNSQFTILGHDVQLPVFRRNTQSPSSGENKIESACSSKILASMP
jgi:hypothetical protein